ncbi:MAG TPA: hypothetical protein PK668_25605 [Myxococcota bacterium]|nr:hypothetical protein [Myxococcota bacterium]HRY96904.1 hypothetical protein [Myxococcota bacterium]HSA22951.1 hypothetical protein [Myxococcota bacterium]
MKAGTMLVLTGCLLLTSALSLAAEGGEVPPAPAATAEVSPAEEANVLCVGAKAGVNLPQLGSSLGTTFAVSLEAMYLLPFWGSRFGLITALGFSQPGASGSGADPRLPDGAYTWETTQRQIPWDLGLVLRVWPADSDYNLGFAVGSRLMFLSTLTSGEAGGEPFGEHDEQATIPGLFAGVQGEYVLGPGALFAEVVYAASFQDLKTTGDLTLSSIGILVGYRFIISL